MENEKTEGGKSCCETKKCCGCKVLAALLLLLVGGLGGYCIGKRCQSGTMMCADHHKEVTVEKTVTTEAPKKK